MIEQREVDGKKATVAYMNDKFIPVAKKKATMVKIIFEDGTIHFLTKKKDKT